MRRALLIAAVTAAVTALGTYWLVNSLQYIAWRFASERMIRDYVIALFICKEDLHLGAETLARLQETYRPWREQLLPSGIYYWVVRCHELGPLPEFGPDLDRWLLSPKAILQRSGGKMGGQPVSSPMIPLPGRPSRPSLAEAMSVETSRT